MPVDTHFQPHRHAWAQLAYCAIGIVQVTVATPGEVTTYIVPPSRGVWIAPGARHSITVLEAADLPNARKPAYVLTIDFGPYGIKRSSAQITKHYTKDELIGRQVVAVINFPEKQVGAVMSQCLVTGFADANGDIVLTALERPVPNGSRLH